MINNPPIDLTKALRTWAFRNNVTPAKFRTRMNWSYTYAYNVVSPKGNGHFMEAAWGRFITAYGMNSLKELFDIAQVDPNRVARTDE